MQRIAIDTNLLVLFCVGSIKRGLIATHKRTRAFSAEDFDELKAVIAGADRFVTLPYVIAEVANLLDRDANWATRIAPILAAFLELADEAGVSSRSVISMPQIGWLGLTDSAWVDALHDDTLLLSADKRLVSAALQAGKHAALFPAGMH